MSRGVKRIVLVGAITLAIMAIGAIFFVPAFIDGSMPGPERVTTDQLARGERPSTTYVVLTGKVLPVFVEELPGGSGSTPTRHYYVPLVTADERTVPVVVDYSGMPPDIERLGETIEVEGILVGSFPFDGPDNKARRELVAMTDQRLTDPFDVVDPEWTPPMRLEMAWGIFSSCLILGLLLGGIIGIQVYPLRSKSPQSG